MYTQQKYPLQKFLFPTLIDEIQLTSPEGETSTKSDKRPNTYRFGTYVLLKAYNAFTFDDKELNMSSVSFNIRMNKKLKERAFHNIESYGQTPA